MDELLRQGGFAAGAVAVVLLLERLIKLVVPLIRKDPESKPRESTDPHVECRIPEDLDFRQMSLRIAELHSWHSVRDTDGAPVWYIRGSLLETMETIARSQIQIAEVLRELSQLVKSTRESVTRMEVRMEVQGEMKREGS